ncbi:hypothetical protein BDV93DRAFT_525517 [Ceratobasidium sp. AG-I]|nr:hypothetical protein BDV93DRAFT_525517 [Ceratobasidium sp. AG-I]
MDKITCINSLHPELLAQIFSLVVHETHSALAILTGNVFEPYSTNSYIMGPTKNKIALSKAVILSGVCGYWRSIVLHTSSFWTYTSIVLTNQHIQHSLDSVPTWLSRAHTTPLDIYLTMRRINDIPVSKTMFDQVVPRLSFGSKQIGTLHLALLSASYLNTLLKTWFRDGVSTTLTKLEIDVANATDEISTLQGWISQCQELQALRLNVGILCSDPFPVMLKLVSLEIFSEHPPITTTRLASMLHACPNLRRLKLDDLYIEGTASGDAIPAPLQYLEMLSLQLLDSERIFPLLSPKSNSLSLSIFPYMGNSSSSDSVNHIIDFSRRSTITALELYADEIESSDLRRLVLSLPHLQTLSLQGCYFDDRMASTLRGASEADSVEGAKSSTSSTLHTIWLKESTIENESTLLSLVSQRHLKQLKIEDCFFESLRAIVEAKELCEHLLGAVSDLSIMNYDKDRNPACFP